MQTQITKENKQVVYQTNTNETNKTNKRIVKTFIRALYDMKLKMISEINDNRPWTTVDLTIVLQFSRPLFPNQIFPKGFREQSWNEYMNF